MRMPITIGMNITENSERWPTTSVATAIDQQRLMASTISMRIGLPTRQKASRSRPSVSAKASRVARSLSRKAATISSLASAGLPVTPTSTSGNSERSAATVARTPSIASRSPADLLEPIGGEVEERPALELLGVDPVVEVVERHPVRAQLAHQAVRVDGRLGQRRRLDGEDEVVELGELPVELDIPLDVPLALRQERAVGGRELQKGGGIEDGHHRQPGGRGHRPA